MSLIDCHAHCLPPTILDALREFAAGSYLGRTLYADEGFSSLEKHLTLMDRFDVDKEVINYGNLLVPAARARKLPMDKVVKMVNDYIAEASRIAPGRFIPAAAVDPLGGEAAMEELDRAVEKLGLFGISLSTNLDGRALDDPVYEPIFERAKAWNMPLWVHPGQVPQAWQQALGLNNRYLNSGVGFLLDDMLCLIKMITANVFDRWWGVKFVFCQLGGFCRLRWAGSINSFSSSGACTSRKKNRCRNIFSGAWSNTAKPFTSTRIPQTRRRSAALSIA